ncbi:hypothetical protein PQ676_07750, partial [Rickettsia felis]|nr:hypothetical protein [Rickettsia felis]
HSQIKEICEVPINTALICLVWSDKDIRDKFQKNSDEDFNISQLYHEVVSWLNNRHLEKTQNKYKNKTEANNHLKNKMSFLEQIAYESLVVTGKLVERKLVEDKKDTLDIDEVIEQGLLKREGINYQFIHLTFQEFLAALRLKNQLLDNHTKSKTASFIGEHRNDPKYLMTLKFLAGIVNNENNQELIEIFWEAVTCNVDSILELGIERKIILLMHLLAQSKINGKFDNRIPNLTQIQNLIDDIVLKDIPIWEQHIIDSGYLSEVIVKTVNEKLQNKEAVFQEFKTATEIITGLANRNEWGSKTKVYTRLIGLLKIKNKQLKELVLQKLAQILDETIDQTVLQESLKKIVPLLNKEILNKYIKIILAKIITIVPDLGEEVLNQVYKLNNKFLNETLITSSLVKILIVMPTQKAITISKKLLIKPNYELKFAAASGLFWAVKTIPTQEAIIILKELLVNPNSAVKHVIANNLPKIIKLTPSLAREAFIFLREEIMNPNAGNNLKSVATEGIVEIVETSPNLASEAFTFLKGVITNSKIDPYTQSIAAQNISKIVIMMPSLVPEAFNFLKELFTNPKANSDVKFETTRSIAEIAKVMPTQGAFTFLKIVIINPKTNQYIKPKVTRSIIEIVRKTSSLAEEAFVFLKLVITNPYTGYNIRSEFIRNIAWVVKGAPSLAQQVFTFLREIITTHNTYNVEYEATRSIAKVVKIKSNLTQKAFAFIKNRIIAHKDDINYAAAISLIEVANVIPLNKASYKPINELLTIIDLTKTKDHYKGLYLEAQTTLHKITHHLTQEYEKGKNPEVIEWFTESFNKLPNISETRIFLKEICQSILKSGVINELESKFRRVCN